MEGIKRQIMEALVGIDKKGQKPGAYPGRADPRLIAQMLMRGAA